MDRRAFLSGGQGGNAPIRPPYTKLNEMAFFDACTACGDCIEACPEDLLLSGYQGRPEVDFTNSYCTFCGACAQSCSHGVLVSPSQDDAPSQSRAWPLKVHVTSQCLEARAVACRACESSCGYDAMRFRPQLGGRTALIIDADRCTGCGECLASCPVQALSIQADPELQEQLASTTKSPISDTSQPDQQQKECPL